MAAMTWFALLRVDGDVVDDVLVRRLRLDEVSVPNVACASCEPGTVQACGAISAGCPGSARTPSFQAPVLVAVVCHQTPRSVAAQTFYRSRRSAAAPIVVDSSSLPPTRVQLVFDVGFVST